MPQEKPKSFEQFATLAAFAIPTFLLVRQLMLPLWFDEVYTLGTFASRPVAEIISDYSEPNNHIGYSLLMHLLSGFPPEPLVHRAPSLLFGLGTLATVFYMTKQISNHGTALLAVVLLGTNQVFQNFAMQIRGYSLSMFLFAVIARLLFTDDTLGKTKGIVAILLSAYCIYVIPTNAFFVIALGVASVMGRLIGQPSRFSLAPLLISVAAVVLGCLLYLPVAGQMRELAASDSFDFGALMRNQLGLWQSVFHDLPHQIAAVASIACGLHTIRNHASLSAAQARILLATAMAIVVPVTVAGLAGVAPFGRNYLPAVPITLLSCALLLSVNCAALLHKPLSKSFARTAVLALAAYQLYMCLTFPQRLSEARLAGQQETPYLLYTAAEFDPGAAVEVVSQSARKREFYACVMTSRAWQNLGHEFTSFDLPVQIVDRKPDGPYVDVIYVISMAPPNVTSLSQSTGLKEQFFSQHDEPKTIVGGFIISPIRGRRAIPERMLLQ